MLTLKLSAKPLAIAALAGALAFATQAAAQVVPGDTYSFDVIAFNNTANVAAYAVAPETAIFGTTTTLTGVGLGGSNVTISSSEVIGASTTTDFFTVSTPANFAPTGYKIGTSVIQGLEFDIAQDANANTVDYLTPVTNNTEAGDAIYLTNTVFTESPVATLTNNNESMAAYEGIAVGSGSINADKVHQFDYSITYSTLAISAAPELSTWLLMIAGVGMIGATLRMGRQRGSFATA